jgi:hypothetical protein
MHKWILKRTSLSLESKAQWDVLVSSNHTLTFWFQQYI